MKKGFVLLLLAVFASSITLFAQDNDKVKKDRPTKEERIEIMTKRMSSKLMLNDSQSAKFASVYKNYLNEIQELRPQKAEIKGKIDDAQRDKMTREGFAHQRKMIDLKEKYYNEFSKFLTPEQADLDIFKNHICANFKDKIEVCFAFQDLDNIPSDVKMPEGRTKSLGTAQALLCAKPYIDGRFVMINADDFNGFDSYKKVADF